MWQGHVGSWLPCSHPDRTTRRSNHSSGVPAPLQARQQRIADPAGPNREGVHRDTQPIGQFAATLDLLPPRIAVVVDDERALLRLQLLQAPVQAVEALLAQREVLSQLGQARSDRRDSSRFVETHVAALAPEIFEEDEPRDDVAVARRRPGGNGAALLQRASDPIERLVSQLLGCGTVPPIEVQDQPPAHLEIPLAVRLGTVVQPCQQSVEYVLRKFWCFSKDLFCQHVHAGSVFCVIYRRKLRDSLKAPR